MVDQALFSSEKTVWETPQWLFDELNQKYNFTLDPSATKHNAKCGTYYTIEDDGLSKEWKGRVFCNPPYGRYKTPKWVKKAHDEFYNGNAELVVLLIPARTDTRWFHDYIYNKADIEFLKGRLKFELDGQSLGSAPFPSMLVKYTRE